MIAGAIGVIAEINPKALYKRHEQGWLQEVETDLDHVLQRIERARKDGQPLSLKGKAVWYVRNPKGHPFIFRVGIEFRELTQDLRESIRTFINIYLSASDVA